LEKDTLRRLWDVEEAQTYAFLAKDLREGTDTVPGFDYALERHRLVDAIERASQIGVPGMNPGAIRRDRRRPRIASRRKRFR
jgi:hypothetical protein